jgi:hypothetical protein
MEETIYESFLELENPANRTFNANYDASKLQISQLTERLLGVLKSD